MRKILEIGIKSALLAWGIALGFVIVIFILLDTGLDGNVIEIILVFGIACAAIISVTRSFKPKAKFKDADVTYATSRYSIDDIELPNDLGIDLNFVHNEARRIAKEESARKLKAFVLAIIVFVTVGVTIKVLKGMAVFLLIPIIVAVVIIFILLTSSHKSDTGKYNNFRSLFYGEIVTPLFRWLFPDGRVDANDGEDLYSEFVKVGAIKSFESADANGYLCSDCTAKSDNYFEMSNVKAWHTEKDSDGDEHTYIDFVGQIIKFKYKKKLQHPVHIVSTYKVSGKKEIDLSDNLGYAIPTRDSIDTENDQFNNNFQVCCTDPVTAFYVLNPVVIESLLRIKDRFNGFSLRLDGNTVYLVLNTNMKVLSCPKNASGFSDLDLKEIALNLLYIEDSISSIQYGINGYCGADELF